MTVSNLWAVLDEAGCGRPVKINDFNFTRGQQTILAVDLSIWICEGIASTALSTFHSDPALHLVYTRTIKLLRLGLGLVFVAEGLRRSIRTEGGGGDKVIVRRSGSQFLDACRRCEIMLKALGVPVVRADAEAEALCALLDSSGVVDGVISNDGDCFLFGARTIYTNFTLENLEEGKVMRYDSKRLTAIVGSLDSDVQTRKIGLCREDLIAFSMISGSDMCGAGVLNCGHRKAVRFLDACRRTTRQCDDRTCLDKLLSWSDESATITLASRKCNIDCDDDGPCTIPLSRRCSICLHAGDKVNHQTHGCAECGTEPGECCIAVTSDEKFLRSLKEKALSRSSTLAPRHIVDQYFSPNGNTLPLRLRSFQSKPYNSAPDPATMFTTSMIFKGRTKESSHEYIKQTLPKLLARLDLWSSGPRNRYALTSKPKDKPVPIRINKCVVRNLVPCYEVTWSITICVVDKDDTLEFNTCEFQSLVDCAYPQLVETFHQQERRRQQARFQDERRKRFSVGCNVARKNNNAKRNERHEAFNEGGGKKKRKYDRNFEVIKMRNTSTGLPLPPELGLDVSLLLDNMPEELSDSDVTIPLDDSTGKDYEEILDDDFLHEILFSDNQNIDEFDVGSCDDEYHFLPMHEVLVENECDRRCDYCPIGARDDIGNSYDHLSSNDLNQCDLTKEVLYCDFGTIQVPVSPIIPHRSRINPIN